MTSSWEFNVHEVAQSSIRHANHFLSGISNQNQKRSIQEVSLIAHEAINGFKKLITLLDGPMKPDCKRIRKGPQRNFHAINPVHIMDSPIGMSQSTGCHSNQSHLVRKVMPLQNILSSTRALIPSSGCNLYRQNQEPTLELCNSETNLMGSTKLITGLNLSLEQQDVSLIRVDGNHVEKKIIHRSSSEIVSFQDESSIFSTSGVKSKETSVRSVASTGGCHCSKRKLRKRKSIRVPAVSNKLAEIPPDDYSWRKYGQKPIKGSPHPRSYYRCSGMNDCPAKKLVERCLDDPTMLVVTYEGDHNHLRI